MPHTMAVRNPLREGLQGERVPPPCTMVIFGASGDLTKRKLVPALYSLARDRLLPSPFNVVGVAGARSRTRTSASRCASRATSSRAAGRSRRRCGRLRAGHLLRAGHVRDPPPTSGSRSASTRSTSSAAPAATASSTCRRRREYPTIIKTRRAGLINDTKGPFTRVIIEKPFGRDLDIGARAQRRPCTRSARGADLPHRPLPRQGDGAEHPGVPLRQRALRAAVEPQATSTTCRSPSPRRSASRARGGYYDKAGVAARHGAEPPAPVAVR